jgi:transcriptional regulator with XRE-family HTH domain
MKNQEEVSAEDKLARIFQKRRKELGLSYKQVEKLGKEFGGGFNYQTVFKLEKGKLRLKPSVLKKIAKALGFEIPKDLLPKFKAHRLSSISSTELGKSMRIQRLEMELTFLGFGKILGVSSAVVSGLESGKYTASKNMLARISKALKDLEQKGGSSVQPLIS